jgi:hypothetical protein
MTQEIPFRLTEHLDDYITDTITWERIQQHTLDYCAAKNINGMVNCETEHTQAIDEYIDSADFKHLVYHIWGDRLAPHLRNQLLIDILEQ